MADEEQITNDTQSLVVADEQLTRRKNFRWTAEMISRLVSALQEYKSKMEYRNMDFDADKPAQYKYLRPQISKFHSGNPQEIHFFGPVDKSQPSKAFENLSPEEQGEFRKIQQNRQNFSKAVVSGKRSGSGKLVYEFHDQLVAIWDGSPNVEKLSCGISTESIAANNSIGEGDLLYEGEDADQEEESNEVSGISAKFVTGVPGRKRKAPANENSVPKLVDNKRKHLEKNLSSSQRDQLLINEAKEDKILRRNLCETMKQSNENFSKAIENMSRSMMQIATGISHSMQMMVHALSLQQQPVQQPIDQNLFYQNQNPYPGQSFHQSRSSRQQHQDNDIYTLHDIDNNKNIKIHYAFFQFIFLFVGLHNNIFKLVCLNLHFLFYGYMLYEI